MNSHQINTFALVGAKVIDIFTGNKSVLDIVVEGERIVQIGEHNTLEINQGVRLIDAHGKYAIPGLCDMHVHMTAWPELLESVSLMFIANGVTSVRDMGGNLEEILSFRNNARKPNSIAPHLWIAGPIIDGQPPIISGDDARHGLPNMSVVASTPEEAFHIVDELADSGVDFIKSYEMLLPEVFKTILQRSQQRTLKNAGHLPIRMTIPQVLDQGDIDIQHLGGMCSGMKFECMIDSEAAFERRVSVLDDPLGSSNGLDLMMKILSLEPIDFSSDALDKREELIKLFVEKSTWHTPTLVNTVGLRTLGFDRLPSWASAFQFLPSVRKAEFEHGHETKEMSKEEEAWRLWNLETIALMHKSGVKMLAGTDCPPLPSYTPGFGLHFELKALCVAGLSPLSALQTATINPAEFFKMTDDLGSISVGKYADIVLLDEDPTADIDNTTSISAVVTRGKYLNRGVLDDLLEKSLEA